MPALGASVSEWFVRPPRFSASVAVRLNMSILALCLLVSAFVAGCAAIGEWRTRYRASLVEELRARVPWIDEVIWDIDGDWIPWPWQADQRSPEAVLARLDRANDAHQDGLWVPWGDGHLARQQFISYLIGWNNEQRLCDRMTLQFPALAARVCADRSELLAIEWRQFFVDKLHDRYYANIVNGHPVLGVRSTRSARACNVAPVDVEVARVEQLATDSLEAFYRRSLAIAIPGLYQGAWLRLAVGECMEHSLHGFDLTPSMLVHMRPQDATFEAWFANIWTTYYATELTEAAVRSSLFAQRESSIRGRFCTPAEQTNRAVDTSRTTCAGAEPILPYVEGFETGGGALFFAATYPKVSSYQAVLNDRQTLVDEPRLAAVRQSARAWNRLAVRYKVVQEQWAGRAPRYELGGMLVDVNGPFELGVAASGIPQRTILFEDVMIPSEGVIVAVNGELVYGVEDMYEQLTRHGSSRSAGIDALLKVQMLTDDGVMEYSTRFRFNVGVPQEFDTHVGFTAGLVEGMTFGSEGLACFFKRLWSGMNQASCTWLDSQRNAYARQVAPQAFRAGEIVSFLVPWGPVAIKALSRGRRVGRLSRALLAGGIEAVLAGSYEVLAAPPVVPLEQRVEHAKIGVAFGFLFGAVLTK